MKNIIEFREFDSRALSAASKAARNNLYKDYISPGGLTIGAVDAAFALCEQQGIAIEILKHGFKIDPEGHDKLKAFVKHVMSHPDLGHYGAEIIVVIGTLAGALDVA